MARPYNSPDVFRAIAHPVRRRMIDMLRKGPLTAGELGRPFNMAQPSISEHIRALRIAGIVRTRTRGKHYLHALVQGSLRPIEDWMHRQR
jgi:DNA-binding transcriptional ArsR family regulator